MGKGLKGGRGGEDEERKKEGVGKRLGREERGDEEKEWEERGKGR